MGGEPLDGNEIRLEEGEDASVPRWRAEQKSVTSPGLQETFLRWLQTSVDGDAHYLEFELLLLAFATGIQDAGSFPKFHTFVSNQTGNTVLIAVSALSLAGDRSETNFQLPLPHVVTSLFVFIGGTFMTGQLVNLLRCGKTRWWLLLSNLIQTLMALAAALILHLNHEAENFSAPILGSIALLAYSSGMQVALSRQLKMAEIPTAQATAAYVDLLIDPRFFAGLTENTSRNRRACFIFALFAGSFAGAGAYKISVALTILLSGLVKALVTIMFLFNSQKKPADSGG